jgi:aminocarboxymuconate-semialdehyde decarboxylase
MKVDMHTHVIPPSLVAETERLGGLFGVRREGDVLVHPEGFQAPLEPDFHDVGALLARMDANGIDVSIVSIAPPLFFYGLAAPEAVAFARDANDAIAAMVAGETRLEGLAHLPLQDPEAAAAELERAVRELGLRGALIGTNAGETMLDEEPMEPLLATASALSVPLVLHPYFVGPKPRLEPYFFTNSIGNPLDTAIAAARLIHRGTLDRHPGLRPVLVHGAGYLPYQLGRLDHAFTVRPEAREAIERPPSSYLDRFWIDTLTHSDASLRFLAEQVGEDRLLLGTDLPYDMADRRPLPRLERAGLDADAIGVGSCELFGLAEALAGEWAPTRE